MKVSMSSINGAIQAVEEARLEWVKNDKVYSALGVALRSLRATQKKAQKEIAIGYAETIIGPTWTKTFSQKQDEYIQNFASAQTKENQ